MKPSTRRVKPPPRLKGPNTPPAWLFQFRKLIVQSQERPPERQHTVPGARQPSTGAHQFRERQIHESPGFSGEVFVFWRAIKICS
jgi:hypothetical protein